MANSLVGTPQAGSSNNGLNVTLTFDVALAQGDVVIIFGGTPFRSGAPLGPSTAGYTLIASHTAAAPAFGAWYKVMGVTPDTTVVGQGTGNGQDATAYCCYAIRGVSAVVLDQTVAVAGPTTGTNPDCPTITTQRVGAWVLALAGSQVNDTAITYPSGYTNGVQASGNDNNDISVAGARLQVDTPGATDPPAYADWLSGANYRITVSVKPNNVDLNLEPGSYSVSGAALTVQATRVLNLEPGVYSVTGFDLSLAKGVALNLEPGSYSLAGADVSFLVNRAINLEPGSYSVSGFDLTALAARVLNLEPGSYLVSGQGATLLAGRALNLEPGVYTVTGAAATLSKAYSVNLEAGLYTVTGFDATLASSGAPVVAGGGGIGLAALPLLRKMRKDREEEEVIRFLIEGEEL